MTCCTPAGQDKPCTWCGHRGHHAFDCPKLTGKKTVYGVCK